MSLSSGLNAGVAGVALDKRNGAVAWNSGGGPPGYATPVPFEQGGQRLSEPIRRFAWLDGEVRCGADWFAIWTMSYANTRKE